MKYLFTLIFAIMTVSLGAHAQSYQIQRRDMKLATQKLVESWAITNPVVAASNTIKTTYAGPTSAATVTLLAASLTAQPDVPRALSITPTGTTGDVEACIVTVNGTNVLNKVISETFTFVADQSTIVNGAKAFKTITSVVWPASCESGGFAATWVIGQTDALGLNHCMTNAGQVLGSVFNSAWETTRPTCLANASAVESNTCDINGTLDGTKSAEIFYFQNFACVN